MRKNCLFGFCIGQDLERRSRPPITARYLYLHFRHSSYDAVTGHYPIANYTSLCALRHGEQNGI
jgi:hypothetical protein